MMDLNTSQPSLKNSYWYVIDRWWQDATIIKLHGIQHPVSSSLRPSLCLKQKFCNGFKKKKKKEEKVAWEGRWNHAFKNNDTECASWSDLRGVSNPFILHIWTSWPKRIKWFRRDYTAAFNRAMGIVLWSKLNNIE